MPDTTDAIQGRYVTALNVVMGDLPIQPYARRITNVVIQGPVRSTFKLYRGAIPTPAQQLSSTPTGGGQDNTYDSTTDGAPVFVGPGEQCIGVWSGGAVAAGQTGTAIVRSTY